MRLPAFQHVVMIALLGILASMPGAALAITIEFDFEELPLDETGYYNGSDQAGGFASCGTWFNNQYITLGNGSWNGWSYSHTTDTTTPGAENQYSAYAGSGAGNSSQYGVAFSGLDGGGGIMPLITLPPNSEPVSVTVTNTTYAALSMLIGDSFAKKFGGDSGNDPDWFLLTVEGRDATDTVVGNVSLYLADYRPANSVEDYILEQWTELDLSSLAGLAVKNLAFRLSSSDNGQFGMNTPAYVAIDDLSLDVSVIPGDFDFDQTVDHLDLQIWEEHYGTLSGAKLCQGDANEDGVVNGSDFLIWQRNFTPASAFALAVPEPSASILLLGFVLATNITRSFTPHCYQQKFCTS